MLFAEAGYFNASISPVDDVYLKGGVDVETRTIRNEDPSNLRLIKKHYRLCCGNEVVATHMIALFES